MDPLSVLLVATLLVAPASGGNLLVKEVSTTSVHMDWTELIAGVELMMDGVYHNVTLLFSTADPSTFRLVEQSSFAGSIGLRVSNPLLGTLSAVSEYKVYHIRFVGEVTLNQTALFVPESGFISLRILGSITVEMGGVATTTEANALALIWIHDGAVERAKLGVPMGWPFQLLLA